METVYILLFFLISFLYSSVGHGGASGYIALMIFIGIDQSIIKSNGLIFNLFVSLIAFTGYFKANYFNYQLFFPLIILSIPFAYLGGLISISNQGYKYLLIFFLIGSIIQLVYNFKNHDQLRPMNTYVGIFLGAVIGFVSGLLGIGGGIILSPILILFRWTTIKTAAAISAPFIFINSLAGLMGFYSKNSFDLHSILFYPLIAVIVGGTLGTIIGSRVFSSNLLKISLILVIFIAIIKLLN